MHFILKEEGRIAKVTVVKHLAWISGDKRVKGNCSKEAEERYSACAEVDAGTLRVKLNQAYLSKAFVTCMSCGLSKKRFYCCYKFMLFIWKPELKNGTYMETETGRNLPFARSHCKSP